MGILGNLAVGFGAILAGDAKAQTLRVGSIGQARSNGFWQLVVPVTGDLHKDGIHTLIIADT